MIFKLKKEVSLVFLIMFSIIQVTAIPSDEGSNIVFNYPANTSTYNVSYADNSGQLQGRDTNQLVSYIQGLFDSVYCKLTGCSMSGNINLNNNNLTFSGGTIENVSHIQFNPAGNGCVDEFCLEVDSTMDKMVLTMAGGNVVNSIGFETYFGDGRVRNDEATTIANCKAVYQSGGTGNVPEVKIAGVNKGYRIGQAVVGLTTEEIGSNQLGYVTSQGIVRECNTTAFSEGDSLFLFNDGGFTNIPPAGNNGTIFIGTVNRAHETEGEINVLIEKISGIEDVLYSRNNANGQSLYNLTNLTALNVNSKFNWTSGDDWTSFNGYNLLFNESKLATIYYNATSGQNISGSISGTINLTQHPTGQYDGVTFNITERVSAPALDVRVNFTDGIESFNNGIIRYYTSSIAGDTPIIQLWDYVEEEWEDYPQLTETTTFAIIEQSVFDYMSHVQNGTVQMRLYKAGTGNVNNKYYIDWLAIAKGYGTPAGEEVDPLSWHKDGSSTASGNWNIGLYNLTTTGYINAGVLMADNLFSSSGSGINVNDDIDLGINTLSARISYIRDILLKDGASTYGELGLTTDGATLKVDLESTTGINLLIDSGNNLDITADEIMNITAKNLNIKTPINLLNNNLTTTNNITAGYFIGDGSSLTNLPSPNLTPYWLSNGSSTASGNWNIGLYNLTTTKLISNRKVLINGSEDSMSKLQIGNAIPGASGTLYAGFSSSNTGNDRIAHFNGESGTSRYEFTLSNSGQGGQWYQNFLSFMVEGGTSQNYYLTNTPGKTSDANWAKIIGQGATSYHKGLIIGEYYDVPVSIGANNKAILFLDGDSSAYAQIVNADLKLLTDNKKLIMGTGGDFEVYYNGVNAVFNTSKVGSGLAYFSNNVSATGFVTRTFITNITNEEAFNLVNYAEDNFYKNGVKNYSVWGECYSPIEVPDESRPVYTTYEEQQCSDFNPATNTPICNLVNVTEVSYPFTRIEGGIDLECKQVMTLKANNWKTHTFDVYENTTDFNTNIMAENYYFQSESVSPDTDYTSIFSDAVPFLTKHTSKYTENITLSTNNIIQGDRVEEQIKDLQGYVLQNEFCRKNNAKWDEYNACMNNGETLGDKIK